MEGRLKLMLMETQERESRLTAAEEAVGMKRESMERDLANRMTEAQQVCRRALIRTLLISPHDRFHKAVKQDHRTGTTWLFEQVSVAATAVFDQVLRMHARRAAS